MTPDPGQLKVSRAPAGLPRARPERIGTWLIWTFGPCIALFGVVFGAALLAMGDDQSKVVGACVILPSGLVGQFLVVASSLRMSHKNWDQSVGI
jgi:hypothetical protein